MQSDPSNTQLAVVSDKDVKGVDVAAGEAVFSGYTDLLQKIMVLKDSGSIKVKSKNETKSLHYKGLREEFLVSYTFTSGECPQS